MVYGLQPSHHISPQDIDKNVRPQHQVGLFLSSQRQLYIGKDRVLPLAPMESQSIGSRDAVLT